ncbi:putative NBD/HSP70 family sugar kinase [Catenulispora sp. EB89]|uniref:ROK family protein n=1 Tax=Catenulispora sp. EB89 TaxID=3156257 RepID=UPI0035113BC5
MRWGAGFVSGDMTRTAVLALLARRGPLSRAQIAELLDLSPATITQGTRRLLAEGLLVEEAPRPSQGGGRPSIPLALVPESAHTIGIQVAHEHVTGVTCRLDAEVVHSFRHTFDPAAPDALQTLITLIRTEIDEARHRGLPLAGVGVAVPGIVDPETGTLRMSVRLGWNGLPLAARLREALGVPVFVDNDISAVTAAERLYGPGADEADFLLAAIGQGIGLGMVLDGAPYRGALGAAGEFGHMPVQPDGPVCVCGNRGCLESLVSTEALLRRAHDAGILPAASDLDDLGTAARNGDPAAVALLQTAATLLGRALAGVVNLLGPRSVVVIGEITALWDLLGEPMHAVLLDHLLPCVRDTTIEVRPWDDELIAASAARVVLAAPLAAPRQRG